MARELTPGERIDLLREQKGWKQAELAERIGVHPSQISRIKTGNTASISSDILIALAKEFGVSTDYILGLGYGESYLDIARTTLFLFIIISIPLVFYLYYLEKNVTEPLNKVSFLLKLIQIYFCDTAALGMASRNESMDFLIELLTEYGEENPEYKDEIRKDQDVVKAQKMRPHEAETEKIKEVLFRMMKDIKQDFENQIPTNPLIMVESMKDMLKTVPRDKRRSTKRDIVSYVSKQMEKQCRNLDPEALELVRDIAERILTIANKND